MPTYTIRSSHSKHTCTHTLFHHLIPNIHAHIHYSINSFQTYMYTLLLSFFHSKHKYIHTYIHSLIHSFQRYIYTHLSPLHSFHTQSQTHYLFLYLSFTHSTHLHNLSVLILSFSHSLTPKLMPKHTYIHTMSLSFTLSTRRHSVCCN